MAFRITPAVFAREVDRRMIDVQGVMELTGLASRQTVWSRVKAGTLPAPVISVDRGYALWDRDVFPEAKEAGGDEPPPRSKERLRELA